MNAFLSALAASLAILCLVPATAPLHALAAPSSDVDLARASAAAVRGVVTRVSAHRDEAVGAIYTDVVIAVIRAWGFSTPPPLVALKLLGGQVGTDALVVGDQAAFTVGEEIIAFLDVRPRDLTLSVAGLARGKWTIGAQPSRGAAARRPAPGGVDEVVDVTAVEAVAPWSGTTVRLPAAAEAQATASAATLALSARSDVAVSGPVVARWHEADWGAPVFVDSAAGGHPLFPAGGVTQFLRALAAWSAAGPLQLSPGVLRTPRCFSNDEWPDGRISVSYDDPCGEIADTSPVVAIGGAYYTSTDVRDVDGVPYWKITKGMVVLDDVMPKFAGMSTGCYEELLTHELGHAIGLAHIAQGLAVMAPSLSPDCATRTESLPLQPADLAALAAPYPPPAGTPGPPVAPGGLSALVDGRAVTVQWLPSAGAPATAFQLQAGSLPGAMDLGALVVQASSFTVPQVAPGVYYLRVVAMNAHGVSAPSSDVTVTVGEGLPGMPTGLVAAGGPGGAVRVFWQAAIGAPVTGYVVLAGYAPGTVAARIPLGSPVLVADHVAPGTYYVRVAALNGAGMGPVSREIAVVVP